MTYELSIVIPTKNRQHTAVETARHAAAAGTASEVQVIVQDCSADARLGAMLAEAGLGERVVYAHTTEALSMPQNWNRGLERADGEYVILIGDDDSVSPDILSTVRWARAIDLDAVKGRDAGCYWYPEVDDPMLAGTLVLPRFTGQAAIVEAGPLLREYATTGDLYHRLPMIYHSLVRRRVLDRVHQKSGRYVDGVSPDVYSAFAIACELDRYGVIDYPVSLVGASALSNTNRLREGVHHRHFDEFPQYEFTWLAPDSFEMVAANLDNMVRAFENVGRPDLVRSVDYRRVYARTIVAEPRRSFAHLRKFLRVCRRLRVNRAVAVAGLLAAIAVKVALNAARRVAGVVRGVPQRSDRERFSGVGSLSAALQQQTQWLAEHGVKPVEGP
jgi:glycosyltransferase involved in cell wall biosynthesis